MATVRAVPHAPGRRRPGGPVRVVRRAVRRRRFRRVPAVPAHRHVGRSGQGDQLRLRHRSPPTCSTAGGRSTPRAVPPRRDPVRALYSVTFFVNVGVNALGLHMLPAGPLAGAGRWVHRPGRRDDHQLRHAADVVFRDTARAGRSAEPRHRHRICGGLTADGRYLSRPWSSDDRELAPTAIRHAPPAAAPSEAGRHPRPVRRAVGAGPPRPVRQGRDRGGRPHAARDRALRPRTTVSTNTYFGRFPASYWQRWTTVTEVQVELDCTGSGEITVHASDSLGDSRVVTGEHVSGATEPQGAPGRAGGQVHRRRRAVAGDSPPPTPTCGSSGCAGRCPHRTGSRRPPW